MIVAVVRLNPGSRNLCSACQSSVSTMKNNVCCEFAPYRPISVTPSTVASGHDLFLRVELGFVAGCGVAAAAMWVFLANRIRHGIPEDALADFVEQIEHEQLEI